MKKSWMTMKTMKTQGPISSCIGWKPRPTRKLAVQFTTTAIEVAVGRPGKEMGQELMIVDCHFGEIKSDNETAVHCGRKIH